VDDDAPPADALPDVAPPDVADPADLADALRSLQWRLRRAAHASGDDAGVTPAQGRVLRVVGHSDEPPRMGEVADRLHIAPRSLTDLVDPLEQAGLLRRTQDPANRRVWRLELTDGGRDVLGALRSRSRAHAAAAFSVLAPHERTQLLTLLRRVESGLDDA